MPLTITKHSETFSSVPQITPEDVAEVAALGFKTIINARPDHEGGHDQPTSDSIKAAAEAAGLHYLHIPVIPNNIQTTDIETCARFITDAPTPVLGFCKSGMRATSLHASALKASKPKTPISKQNGLMRKISRIFKTNTQSTAN